MKQLIEDLISMMEYHVEQTRPIHTTTVALQAAREALKSLSAQPAPVQEPVAWLEILRNNKTATDEVIGAFLRGHAEYLTGETFVIATATPPARKPQNCGTGFCSCIECVMPKKQNGLF